MNLKFLYGVFYFLLFSFAIYATEVLSPFVIINEEHINKYEERLAQSLLDIFEEENKLGTDEILQEKREAFIEKYEIYKNDLLKLNKDELDTYYKSIGIFDKVLIHIIDHTTRENKDKIQFIFDHLVLININFYIELAKKLEGNNLSSLEFTCMISEEFSKICNSNGLFLSVEKLCTITNALINLYEIIDEKIGVDFAPYISDILSYILLQDIKNFEKYDNGIHFDAIRCDDARNYLKKYFDAHKEKIEEKQKIAMFAKDFSDFINNYDEMKVLNRFDEDNTSIILNFYKSIPENYKTNDFMLCLLKNIDNIDVFLNNEKLYDIFKNMTLSDQLGNELFLLAFFEPNKLIKTIKPLIEICKIKDEKQLEKIIFYKGNILNTELACVILNYKLIDFNSFYLIFRDKRDEEKNLQSLLNILQMIEKNEYWRDNDSINYLLLAKKILNFHLAYKNITNKNIENFLNDATEILKYNSTPYLPYLILNHFYEYLSKNFDKMSASFWSGSIHEEMIADYYSIYYMQEDLAFYAIKNKLKDEKITLDFEKIKKRLKENFSNGFFSFFNNIYKMSTWKGDVADKKPLNQDAPYQYKGTLQEMDIMLGDKTYRYSFYPSDLHSDNPKTIILELYGGHRFDFCNKNIQDKPISNTMMTMDIYLPDCSQNIFQYDQLSPENFKNTHAEYLKIVAQFITFLKNKYPNAKIFLKGASFGGFFVTSYAYLSNCNDFNLYQDFVKDALLQKKNEIETQNAAQNGQNDTLFPKIDGIIIHDGSIDYMNKILKNSDSLNIIQTPILLHQNYDDLRVSVQRIYANLQKFDQNYLRFLLSRTGAQSLLEEFISNKNENYTLRGHINNDKSQNEFNAETLNFIDKVNNGQFGKHRSKFDIEQTKRRIQLAIPVDVDVLKQPKAIDGKWFTKKDVEQFLSNLSFMQTYGTYEKGEKEANLEKILEDIPLPEGITKEEAYQDLKSFTTTKHLWKNLVKRKDEYKESLYIDELKNFNIPNVHHLLKP